MIDAKLQDVSIDHRVIIVVIVEHPSLMIGLVNHELKAHDCFHAYRVITHDYYS